MPQGYERLHPEERCRREAAEKRTCDNSNNKSGLVCLFRPMQQSKSNSQAGTKPSTLETAPQAAPQSHGDLKQDYCTQSCLLGLLQGGPLDQACPNVGEHGHDNHQIDQPTFLRLMREQLALDRDQDVYCPYVHGSRGVFFRVRLSSHGYVVAAKGTPSWFEHSIRHEAVVYQRLRPIQGQHVPVQLGIVDLVRPYYYAGIAELQHMMFMSFGGVPLSRYVTCENKALSTQQAEQSMAAVHRLGVLHRDVAPRNLLWSPEDGRVLVIDFDRAELDPQQGDHSHASLPKTRFLNEKRAVTRKLRAL